MTLRKKERKLILREGDTFSLLTKSYFRYTKIHRSITINLALSRARDTRIETCARGRKKRIHDLMPRDEVSRDEWARNKLHAECAKLRGVICLTPRHSRDAWQLFLSLFLSLAFTLSSNPLFSVYPRNCGPRSAPFSVIGRYQWQLVPPLLCIPLSSGRWSVVLVTLWNMRIDRNSHTVFLYSLTYNFYSDFKFD